MTLSSGAQTGQAFVADVLPQPQGNPFDGEQGANDAWSMAQTFWNWEMANNIIDLQWKSQLFQRID